MGGGTTKAFDQIKEAIANPRILMPSVPSKSLKLYIDVENDSIGCFPRMSRMVQRD